MVKAPPVPVWRVFVHSAKFAYNRGMATMPAVSKRTASSPVHKRICERIRAFREALGWTQTEAAVKHGCSQAYWSELENGRKVPTITQIERVAETLKREPEDFVVRRQVHAA